MHCLHRIAAKIADVKRQYPFDAMHLHQGDKFCVMYLCAKHGVRDNQAPPLPVNRRQIGEERQNPLDLLDLGKCGRHIEAKPVIDGGASHNVPKFRNRLKRVMHRLAGCQETGYAFHRDGEAGVVRLGAAEQDIGIDQNAHLATFGVEAFPADRRVRQRRRMRQAFGPFAPRGGALRMRQRRSLTLERHFE